MWIHRSIVIVGMAIAPIASARPDEPISARRASGPSMVRAQGTVRPRAVHSSPQRAPAPPPAIPSGGRGRRGPRDHGTGARSSGARSAVSDLRIAQIPGQPAKVKPPGAKAPTPIPAPTPSGQVEPRPKAPEPRPAEERPEPTPLPSPEEAPSVPEPAEPPSDVATEAEEIPPPELPETDVPPPELPETDVPPPELPATDVPPPELPETDVPPPAGLDTEIPPPAGLGDLPLETAPPSTGAGAGGFTGDVTTISDLATRGTFAIPEVFGDSPGLSTFAVFRPQPPPDLPPPTAPPRPPGNFRPVVSAAFVPSIRSIKIAEDQSPAPRDRLIYSFNFYDNVNESINRRFLAPISDIRAFRHILGFEKTFLDRRASLGLRFPILTVNGNSPLPTVGQTETALGNLNIFAKYAFVIDEEAGRLYSAGLSVTPNTGPAQFAGASYLEPLNNPRIQPFIGVIRVFDRLFAQGFTSIDVPFNPNDVTILYNDYALGYFLHRNPNPNAFLNSVAPVFEVHVNTPLNHRGVRLEDPASTPDFINLTYGASVLFKRRVRLLAGVSTPVTGPRPFSLEAIASLNVYY